MGVASMTCHSVLQRRVKSTNEREWVKLLKYVMLDKFYLAGLWAEDEYPASEWGGGARCRIDVAAVVDNFRVAFEIKCSEQDLLSQYGKNFVGEYNYLVVPPELLLKALAYIEEYHTGYNATPVGVIVFDGLRELFIFKHCGYNHLLYKGGYRWLGIAVDACNDVDSHLPFEKVPASEFWRALCRIKNLL